MKSVGWTVALAEFAPDRNQVKGVPTVGEVIEAASKAADIGANPASRRLHRNGRSSSSPRMRVWTGSSRPVRALTGRCGSAQNAYEKAKTPLGSNVIQNALARVAATSPPPEANTYERPISETGGKWCWLSLLATYLCDQSENSRRNGQRSKGTGRARLLGNQRGLYSLARENIVRCNQPNP